MQAEEGLTAEQGVPVRLIFLTPSQVKKANLVWQIVVTAKEKQTSEVNKLLFRAEMQDAQLFGPLLNLDYLAERFASVWEENPQKMFKKMAEVMPPVSNAPGVPGQESQGGTLSPSTNLPTPEKMMRSRVNNQLGVGA